MLFQAPRLVNENLHETGRSHPYMQAHPLKGDWVTDTYDKALSCLCTCRYTELIQVPEREELSPIQTKEQSERAQGSAPSDLTNLSGLTYQYVSLRNYMSRQKDCTDSRNQMGSTIFDRSLA